MVRFGHARISIALVSMLIAGCDPGLPKVYPVTGKVVYKGKGPAKDLTGYNVQFQSTTDPKELPGGVIAEDGTFTLYTRVGGKVIPGVKEGTYRACLTQPAVEGGPPPKLVIPRKYISLESANLQYEVNGQPTEITVEIER
jgi:hypothetical protein